MLISYSNIFLFSTLFLFIACEDKEQDKEPELIVESFDILLIDNESTGEAGQSQPELV